MHLLARPCYSHHCPSPQHSHYTIPTHGLSCLAILDGEASNPAHTLTTKTRATKLWWVHWIARVHQEYPHPVALIHGTLAPLTPWQMHPDTYHGLEHLPCGSHPSPDWLPVQLLTTMLPQCLARTQLATQTQRFSPTAGSLEGFTLSCHLRIQWPVWVPPALMEKHSLYSTGLSCLAVLDWEASNPAHTLTTKTRATELWWVHWTASVHLEYPHPVALIHGTLAPLTPWQMHPDTCHGLEQLHCGSHPSPDWLPVHLLTTMLPQCLARTQLATPPRKVVPESRFP